MLFLFLGLLFPFRNLYAGKDDLEYAEKLMEKGMADFAEEELADYANLNKTSEAQAKLIYTRSHIKEKAALLEVGEKTDSYFKEAVVLLQEFLSKVKANPKLLDSNKESDSESLVTKYEFELGELYWTRSNFLNKWQEQELDPTKRNNLQLEAEKSFDQTATYFKGLLATYDKKLTEICEKIRDAIDRGDEAEAAKLEKERIKIEDIVISLKYNYILMRYNQAKMYDKSDPKRTKLLKEVITQLEEFLLMYGGIESSTVYAASNLLGACCMELENFEVALRNFKNSTVVLYNKIKTNERFLEHFKDIIQEGFYRTAEVYNLTGKDQLVLDTVGSLLRIYKEDAKDPYVQKAVLERAKALIRLNRKTDGVAQIQQIINSHGPAASEARELLQRLFKELGPDVIPPETVMTNINNLVEWGSYSEALRQSQMFISFLRNRPRNQQEQYIPRVLFLMGKIYRYEVPPRLYEAAIIYEEIYRNYKDAKGKDDKLLAPEVGKWAADCLSKIAQDTKDKNDEEQATWIRNDMAKKGLLQDIDSEVRLADSLADQDKYLEAIPRYQNVAKDENSKYRVRAWASVGYMYYRQATKVSWPAFQKEADQAKKEQLKKETLQYFSQAEQALKDVLKFITDNVNSPIFAQQKETMRSYQRQSTLWLGCIYGHEAVQKNADVLKVLEGFEANWPKDTSDVYYALALKTEAFVKTGDMVKAELQLNILKTWAQKQQREVRKEIILLMAGGYENAIEKIVPIALKDKERVDKINEIKNKTPEIYNQLVDNIEKLEFYLLLIFKDYAKQIKPDEASQYANKIYLAAVDLGGNADYYKDAMQIFKRILDKEFGEKPSGEEPSAIAWKIVVCARAVKDYEFALPYLERLDKEWTDKRSPGLGAVKLYLVETYEELKKWKLACEKWLELAQIFNSQINDQNTPEKNKYLRNEVDNANYHLILIDYKQGFPREAYNKLLTMEKMTEGFKEMNDELKEKLIKLKKDIESVLPQK
jgi:cell fate (sporulation/competence/biofilm development) regulator YlbF (YheA/YmcA/DUF963 family)